MHYLAIWPNPSSRQACEAVCFVGLQADTIAGMVLASVSAAPGQPSPTVGLEAATILAEPSGPGAPHLAQASLMYQLL